MPYAHIPANAVEHLSDMSGATAKVMLAIASFMDQSGTCFPGICKIAERAGIRREPTISKAIGELVTMGIIRVRRRKNRSQIYCWCECEQQQKEDLTENVISKSQDLTLSEGRILRKPFDRSKPEKNTNDTHAPDEFLAMAGKLLAAVKKSERVAQSPQSWPNQFRLLCEKDQAAIASVHSVLDWYQDAVGQEYIPAAYSGATFRKKFNQLLDAMGRAKHQVDQGDVHQVTQSQMEMIEKVEGGE